MTEALIRNPSAILFELVHDPLRRAEVVNAVGRAVTRSFEEDARRDGVPPPRTSRETKRRISICLDLIERLIGDEGWSPIHVRDALPRALRSMLDTGTFNAAAERLCWTPG